MVGILKMVANSTPNSFRKAVLAVLDKFSDKYQGSLEEYLRSLWVLVDKYQHQEPSHALFLRMLEEAFQVEPAGFEAQWLEYDKPLNWGFRDGVYFLTMLRDKKVVITEHDVDDLRILKHTLLFQITDLYRMRDDQLKDKYRYLGVRSPTGYSWYNFDPFTYLECSTAGQVAHHRDGDQEFASCDWVGLAEILELGRIYE